MQILNIPIKPYTRYKVQYIAKSHTEDVQRGYADTYLDDELVSSKVIEHQMYDLWATYSVTVNAEDANRLVVELDVVPLSVRVLYYHGDSWRVLTD